MYFTAGFSVVMMKFQYDGCWHWFLWALCFSFSAPLRVLEQIKQDSNLFSVFHDRIVKCQGRAKEAAGEGGYRRVDARQI